MTRSRSANRLECVQRQNTPDLTETENYNRATYVPIAIISVGQIMTPQTATFQSLLQQTAILTPEQKLRMIAYLADSLRQSQPTPQRRKWSEIRGAAPYPLFGEDAQAWITRNRQETDEHQEHQVNYLIS